MNDAEADPGICEKGGGGGAGNPNSSMPRPKITKIGQKKKKSAKKRGGGGPRPIRPPRIRHCHVRSHGVYVRIQLM